MKLIAIITLFTISLAAFSHGMNKPGPNGGYITMSSNFHVELVNQNANFKIYLLDIQFKNPMIENSEVSLELNGKESFKIECKKEKDYFICNRSGKDLTRFNEIVVRATRANVKGGPAVYKLPLSFE